MGYPFFYLDMGGIDKPPSRLWLKGKEADHISRSLRARVGDEVVVCDGEGYVCRTVIAGREREGTALDVVRCSCAEPLTPRIDLFQALIPPGDMDSLIRMAVEAGVDSVAPFISTRSIRPDSRKVEKWIQRWRRIIKESAKTSRRYFMPVLETPTGWEGLMSRLGDYDSAVLLWEGERDRAISDSLEQESPGRLALVAGPEGGFEESEVADIMDAGATPASLGSANFRSVTAGALASFYVRQHYGNTVELEALSEGCN